MFREWRRSEKLFDEFEKMVEEMNECMRSQSSEPLVYGFSMHIGTDGIPRVEHFGNVRHLDKREPFTSSIIDEKSNELKITAEMPGIEVDPNSAKAKYNNGILEVILKLKNPKPEGKKVKIE